MRTRAVIIHILQALAEGALIALLVVGLMAGTAFAAKGGGKPAAGSSTNLQWYMVHDLNGNRSPDYGDDISFTFSTTTAHPEVGLRCYQGYNWVYDGYVLYWDSAWASLPYFTLSSMNWDSALSASCTARLFYYNRRGLEQVLGTQTFTVGH